MVVAWAVDVAAAAVHGDGGLEVVLTVEVEPAKAGGTGGVFEGVHEAGGDVATAELGKDEEAFALGGLGDSVEAAEEDAAGDLCGVGGGRELSEEEAVGYWLRVAMRDCSSSV